MNGNINQHKAKVKQPQHKKPPHNNHSKNTNPNTNKPRTNNNTGKKPNRNSGGGGRRPKKFVPGPMSEAMKTSLAENVAMNDARMNPWKQINMDNNNKVRFTPLGGLGEIGGNMAVMEDDECAFVIDVGMSFPDETMHGVDI
ncbi:MAG: Zn-dependent hydrolase, RNA-metabolising, partial [uncultured Sulfurovum sp.]